MTVTSLTFTLDGDRATARTERRGTEDAAATALLRRAELLVSLAHCGDPAGPPAGTVSYGLLPDGTGLLCAGEPERRSAGLPRRPGGHLRAVLLPEGGVALAPDLHPGDLADPTRWDTLLTGAAPHTPRATGHARGHPATPPRPARRTLAEFARRHAERLEPFLADVRRLFACPAGRQLVIVEESPDTVAHWVALARASLPADQARALTFTTYTPRPHRAPHQIVGIGPDADFDRYDPELRAHLYRVHDGLGGPGSPHLPDLWAALTARAWLRGQPPLPVAPPTPAGPPALGEPPPPSAEPPTPVPPSSFALGPQWLATMLDEEPGTPGWDELLTHFPALPDHGEVVAAARRRAERDAPDSRSGRRLLALCQALGGHCAPRLLEPLALTLARRRLPPPAGREAAVAREVARLPLSDAARRTLRDAYATPLQEAAARLSGQPVAHWAGLVRLLTALGAGHAPAPDGPPHPTPPSGEISDGPPDGTGAVAAAVDTLAAALLADGEGGTSQAAEAAALLDDLDAPPLTDQVLHRMATTGAGALHRLAEAAPPPTVRWLRRHLADSSPVGLRLVAAAWRLRDEGADDRLRYVTLTRLLPGGAPRDADTLALLWRLVWGDGTPHPGDACRLVRACGMPLLARAGLHRRVAGLLTAPDTVDEELAALAEALLRGDGARELTQRERSVAELLWCALQVARRPRELPEWVPRLTGALCRVDPLDQALRNWCLRQLGSAMAAATPEALWDRRTVTALVTGNQPLLLDVYRDVLLADGTRTRLRDHLSRSPHGATEVFITWRMAWRGLTRDGKDALDELLDELLGPAVYRMTDPHRERVAQRVGDRAPEWARAWDIWWRRWLSSRRSPYRPPRDDDTG